MREIDRRLRYLRQRLDTLTIVDPQPAGTQRVYFGATVTVIDESGARRRYRIVGADETDVATDAISVHSPVSRALLGRAQGDDVVADTPEGKRELFIEAVSYETGDAP